MAGQDFDVLLIAKYWHRRIGFFLVLAPALGAVLYILRDRGLDVIAAGLIATTLSISLLWRLSRRIPRTKKGKLGFVMSIACDAEEEAIRIRSDFIHTVRRLLKTGKSGDSFQVIEIPQFHAVTVIDIEDAHRLRVDTRAHFLLYGRVRSRRHAGKDHMFLELEGMVTHQKVALEVSQRLSIEFAELLPRKVMIAAENELMQFEFTSEWTELVAKYIIGNAAAISRDFDYAEKLYLDVLSRLAVVKADANVIAKLKVRVPKCLADLHEARANWAYFSWVDSKADADLKLLGEFLRKIDVEKYGTRRVIVLNAIFAFIGINDPKSALDWLNKIKNSQRDAVWHLNVGFLHAYDGDLQTAMRHYRKAEEEQMPADVIANVEDFVCYVMEREPGKFQLYYCLGYFNWKIKGDLIQADKDLREFLRLCPPAEFKDEATLAGKWIDRLGVGIKQLA